MRMAHCVTPSAARHYSTSLRHLMQHFTLTMTFLMQKVMSSVKSPVCRYEKLWLKQHSLKIMLLLLFSSFCFSWYALLTCLANVTRILKLKQLQLSPEKVIISGECSSLPGSVPLDH
jgi:hypothetical protein